MHKDIKRGIAALILISATLVVSYVGVVLYIVKHSGH